MVCWVRVRNTCCTDIDVCMSDEIDRVALVKAIVYWP